MLSKAQPVRDERKLHPTSLAVSCLRMVGTLAGAELRSILKTLAPARDASIIVIAVRQALIELSFSR